MRKYTKLITALVDDKAVECGLVTKKNITPILFFMMRVAGEQPTHQWMMPRPEQLKTNRWLQVLNWLMDQLVFVESNKSKIIRHLMDKGELMEYNNARCAQVVMVKPVPPDIERKLQALYDDYFGKGC